jgi:hypothetical protein
VSKILIGNDGVLQGKQEFVWLLIIVRMARKIKEKAITPSNILNRMPDTGWHGDQASVDLAEETDG